LSCQISSVKALLSSAVENPHIALRPWSSNIHCYGPRKFGAACSKSRCFRFSISLVYVCLSSIPSAWTRLCLHHH
jgi:hypothetical protein